MPKTNQRGWAGLTSLTLVLAVVLWTSYFIAVSPEQVHIRLRLDTSATLGSKWRIIVIPAVMVFVYAVLGQAERLGMINTPYKEPITPDEARQIAAKLRVFSLFLLMLILIGLTTGQDWTLRAVCSSLSVCLLTVLTALLTIRFFSNTRRSE